MTGMLTGLISDLIEGVEEFLSMLMIGLLDLVFSPENSMDVGFLGISVGANQFNFIPLFTLFRDIGLALITIKFLKKGFDIYVGWIDGDKDNDVSHLILNYIRAIITVLAFSFVYSFMVGAVQTLLSETLSALVQASLPQGLEDIVPGAITATVTGIAAGAAALKIFLILALVILVMLGIIYFRLMLMGVQLLAMRIAFPLACVGLIDSDKGIFKSYAQKIVMLCVSAFTQIFFFRFALLLLTNGNPLWALAAGMAAMKTPELLRDFMIGYGGAGGLGRGGSMAMQAYFMLRKASFIGSRIPVK